MYLVFANDGNGIAAVQDAHEPNTYVYWINAMYYGNEGWKNYSGENHHNTYEQKNNTTIGTSCFSN